MKALFSLCAMLVLSVIAAPIEIPDWVNVEIKKSYDRFVEWKGDDDVVVFPIMTDLHCSNNENYRHIAYLNHAAKTFPFDCIVDLGDIGLDWKGQKDMDTALKTIQRHADLHFEYTGPVIQVVGNHDHNRSQAQATLTDEQIADIYIKPNLKNGHKLVFSENPTVYYYDIPRAKHRIIALNTSDWDDKQHYYTVSLKQMQFLADSLTFSEPGWTVSVLTHYCVAQFGHWVNSRTNLFNGNVLMPMLNDFQYRMANNVQGVKWDFSKNVNCRLVADFTGDSHFDAQECINGVHYIISQGYGGIGAKDFPADHAVKTPFNPANMMLFDIVVIKPQKRVMKIIRLGAGGADRDRSFKF